MFNFSCLMLNSTKSYYAITILIYLWWKSEHLLFPFCVFAVICAGACIQQSGVCCSFETPLWISSTTYFFDIVFLTYLSNMNFLQFLWQKQKQIFSTKTQVNFADLYQVNLYRVLTCKLCIRGVKHSYLVILCNQKLSFKIVSCLNCFYN